GDCSDQAPPRQHDAAIFLACHGFSSPKSSLGGRLIRPVGREVNPFPAGRATISEASHPRRRGIPDADHAVEILAARPATTYHRARPTLIGLFFQEEIRPYSRISCVWGRNGLDKICRPQAVPTIGGDDWAKPAWSHPRSRVFVAISTTVNHVFLR